MCPSKEDDIYDYSDSDLVSRPVCSECLIVLTREEFELYEDTCESCMHGQTAGIINDNPYRIL